MGFLGFLANASREQQWSLHGWLVAARDLATTPVDFSGVAGNTNLLNGNNSYRYTGPNPPEILKLFSPYFAN